jgi:1-deoxy-D-xylulose-5-phosphate synthase
MAHAARLKGESRKAVAIIGDGAMTGGMAFEALNNGGFQRAGLPDMLVILNDNDMSISPPVGALNRYLARLMSGRFYAAAREGAKSVLKNTPLYGWPSASRSTPRAWWCPATIFEEFGFNYVGPIDGHDLDALIPTLENLRQAKGPQFLHVVTRKGWATSWPRPTRSSTTARASSTRPSGWSSRRPRPRPSPRSSASGCATWPRPTSAWWASRRPCAKARAWSSSKALSHRYHDVGIAEQHAVTFAAGLACEGSSRWWPSTAPSCSVATTS